MPSRFQPGDAVTVVYGTSFSVTLWKYRNGVGDAGMYRKAGVMHHHRVGTVVSTVFERGWHVFVLVGDVCGWCRSISLRRVK